MGGSMYDNGNMGTVVVSEFAVHFNNRYSHGECMRKTAVLWVMMSDDARRELHKHDAKKKASRCAVAYN